MKNLMCYVSIILLLLTVGCSPGEQEKQESGKQQSTQPALSAESSKDLEMHVNKLINQDQYKQALSALNEAGEVDDSLRSRLKEKTHLNYGLYLEYRAKDQSMRDRMTSALRQYIEVLRINRQNQKALSEIKQIMGIYGTMPDKSPPAEIKKDLNELGVTY